MATPPNLSSETSVDPWNTRTSTRPSSRKPATPVVRDDWEDDDDDDEVDKNIIVASSEAFPVNPAPSSPVQTPLTDVEDNRKLWAAANAGVAVPMPTLVSTRSGSVIPPPAAAFQPTMRILKRPQSSSPSQSNTPVPPPSTGSLQERETRYAAARERIFGLEGSEGGGGESLKPSNVKIIREPKGPDTTPGQQTQFAGFRGRGGKATSPPRSPTSG